MFRLTLLAALVLALAMPAAAKDNKDQDHGKSGSDRGQYSRDHDRDHDHAWDRDHRDTFSSAERNLIRSWLLDAERQEAAKHPTTTGLPPGLQKKVERGMALPPGWQKKLARGEHLDREYYSLGRPLPEDLLRRLPPSRPGSEILKIEDQIILIDAATRLILDVFGLGVY
jgi:Ni/Co efflux regulator RcnB